MRTLRWISGDQSFQVLFLLAHCRGRGFGRKDQQRSELKLSTPDNPLFKCSKKLLCRLDSLRGMSSAKRNLDTGDALSKVQSNL